MHTLFEPAREVPVVDEFDICVVGGSCTGVFAAIRAARLGAKVAIVENNGFFGGVATASQVNIWHSVYDIHGEQQIIAGLTTEVTERLKHRNAVWIGAPTDASKYFILHTEELKIELDEMITGAGVRPFLHTRFVAPIVENGRPVAVAIEDKTGRRAVKASYFIDATGDGDLVDRLGYPCYKRSGMQPPTMCAIIRGLDRIKAEYPDFSLSQTVFNPLYPNSLKKGFLWSAGVPGGQGDTMVAGTRVFGVDCSDADQLTKAEMEGRQQVRAICDILRQNFLDEEINPLVALPAKIGIRDTRHARCQHTLTEEEVLYGVRFPDAIANGTYRVDIHNHEAGGILFRYLDGTEVWIDGDGNKDVRRWRAEGEEPTPFYQIPYRSLVPQNGDGNVLIAGRILDADPGAFGAVRVMVNCNQTGEATGVAAYLALNNNAPVEAVEIPKLRQTLAAGGSAII
ncbi:MAG: FAD-dependent oxidoreductase [Caldilineaceae bacterium]|nr:FAD-dependent oxidoreductase [Caldilineaceae bacterium]